MTDTNQTEQPIGTGDLSPCSDGFLEQPIPLLGPLKPYNPQLWENNPASQFSINEDLKESGKDLFNARDPNLAIQHENPRNRLVITLRIQGYTLTEIAKMTDYTVPWVSQILRQPWARKFIVDEMERRGKEAFQGMLEMETIPTLEKMLSLRDSDDDGVALRACQDILDRSRGKAVQKIETDNTHLHIVGKAKELDDRIAQLEAEEQRLLGRSI